MPKPTASPHTPSIIPGSKPSNSSENKRKASEKTPSPIHPSISQILEELQSGTTNDNITPSTKRSNNIVLSTAQFAQLLQTCSKQQETIMLLSTPSPRSMIAENTGHAVSPPAYYSNAKYEEISCKVITPITPIYDGTKDNLIPFLTKLDLRQQNKGLALATYITIEDKQHDLTLHFSLINKTDVEAQATKCWTSLDVAQDKHKVGHETYNSRLLGMVLVKSVTEDFLTTLLHTIPQSLRNDGTLLLSSICHHIHCNNIAFHKSIREKIVLDTLFNFDNDVQKYIIYVKNSLKMVTTGDDESSEHKGLLTYTLHQLKLCPVPHFQDFIRCLHIEYQEGKHQTLTPIGLLKQVDKKIRVLQHAQEWTNDNTPTPSLMALAAAESKPNAVEELLHMQTNFLLSCWRLKTEGPKTMVPNPTMNGNISRLQTQQTLKWLTVKPSTGAPNAAMVKAKGLPRTIPPHILMVFIGISRKHHQTLSIISNSVLVFYVSPKLGRVGASTNLMFLSLELMMLTIRMSSQVTVHNLI
jgi:hypothetical protein